MTEIVATRLNRQETKAETTHAAARAIIDAEAAKREAKTARLRAARLLLEEAQADAPDAKVKATPKAKPASKAKPATEAKAAPKKKAGAAAAKKKAA